MCGSAPSARPHSTRRPPQTDSMIANRRISHRWPPLLLLPALLCAIVAIAAVAPGAHAADPKFDPSTRMRLVLVPADAAVGSVIYRLRATDEEFDYPLQFELVGDAAASAAVQIETLHCTKYNSVCQANVILRRRLDAGRYYDFQVSVKDTKGGMAQQACSITATNHTTPHDVIFPHKTGIIMIPEDAKRGTELDYVIARKNPQYAKPVYLELWGSPLFAIRQKIASPETTEGTVFLLGPLDFETQSMYHLTVLANDAYAEPGQDTRNIAGLEVVVIVQDVQDVPPIFTTAPPVTRLPAGLLPGDKVLQVHAEDGDKGNPREIRYGLVSEGNPFTSFFDINDTTGEIFLVRPIDEIAAITHIGDPVLLTVLAEEVKVLRDEPPAMSTTVQLAFFLPERSNSPPYFENDHYIARIAENSPQGTALVFADPYVPHVYDDDTGKNGVFSLTLLGNNGTFEISPNVAERRASFLIRVRDTQALDYEARHSVQFQILAQELGPATNLSAIVNVTVYIDDVNDNPPVFDLPLYTVELPENMTAGTRVVQVHATDPDTGLGGRVRYTQILGYLNTSLNLDPLTGVVTVTTDKHGFDRELMPEYHLYVEARDMDGAGNVAQVPLVIRLLDVNDNAPVFEKGLYEFILAANLREFTAPAFIRATDADAEEPNNIVRYELINGNYENKFQLDKITGQLTLREPLMLRHPTTKRRRRRQTAGPAAASGGANGESEVFVLTARAYDLGVPVMSAMCTIRIYPPESKARTVMFIVAGRDPDVRKTEESLSAITGGRVIIHSVKPYTGTEPGAINDGREKSVVVATVMYDSASFVDISQIQQKIANSTQSSVIGVTMRESNAEVLSLNTVYRAENRFLFWLLIALALLIALSILTLLFCCICSWCPLYAGARKRVIRVNSTEDDVHLVHRELGVDKQTKSVQVAEWVGRREAWSAPKSADARTKPTHWEFSGGEKLRHDQQHAGDDALGGHTDANGVVVVAATADVDEIVRDDGGGGAADRRTTATTTVQQQKINHHHTTKETQFHHKSTTNLIDERHTDDIHSAGDDDHNDDDDDGGRISAVEPKATKQQRRVQRKKPAPPIDDDSMRRHEIDRGSDVEYEKQKQQARKRRDRQHRRNNDDDDDDDNRANDDDDDDRMEEDDNGDRHPNRRRDQFYIKDGNAEILRLITRGKTADENIYVNVPGGVPAPTIQQQQPQFIMVDNGGKEILMRRFIEEQANGKHIIREHYQIIPPHGLQQPHQQQPATIVGMPNEVLVQHQTHTQQAPPVLHQHTLHIPPPPPLDAKSNAGSAIYAQIPDINVPDQQQSSNNQQQQAAAGSNHSLIHLELETSLKQQNALLRQILLEKERLDEKYSQHETVMETQSLPGHSLAIGTQTDCEAGTQTDPYRRQTPPSEGEKAQRRQQRRRRARSENDDSMSEEDYELVRHRQYDGEGGDVYLVKQRRRTHKKQRSTRVPGTVSGNGGGGGGGRAVRRRVVMVEDIKRKIRTPIKEEGEDGAVLLPQQQPVTQTRTSAMRRERSGLRTEVLAEIADSLATTERERERSQQQQSRVHSRTSHVVRSQQPSRRGSPDDRAASRSRQSHASRSSRHTRREYYEEDEDGRRYALEYDDDDEEDDDSDQDIVVRRNIYSDDSLDEAGFSGSDAELDESHRARGGSRVVHSRQEMRSDYHQQQQQRAEPHVSYRKKDEYYAGGQREQRQPRRRDEKHQSAIPRLARKDSTGAEKRPQQQQQAASGRPAKKLPTRTSQQRLSDETQGMARSQGGGGGGPKYMDWYYNGNRTATAAIGSDPSAEKTTATKKQVGAIERRIKNKAPGFKPEPMPRGQQQQQASSGDGAATTSAAPTQRMLREDVQMNKHHAPKIQTDTNHPLLQYSEHRYEREYNPAPDLPTAPTKLAHYMYPETPPTCGQATNQATPAATVVVHRPAKPIRVSVTSTQGAGKPSPIREHEVKDFKVVIPIEASGSGSHHHHHQHHGGGGGSKQLNVATLEDDLDSGIAMNSLLHSMGRRNPIADKKSVFTIAYDDVRVRRIHPTDSDSPIT